ncbi:2548_t:CDS:1, partial [Funneliformis caledonium]
HQDYYSLFEEIAQANIGELEVMPVLRKLAKPFVIYMQENLK